MKNVFLNYGFDTEHRYVSTAEIEPNIWEVKKDE